MNEDKSLETDAITAHLDRGWDMLQRGDLDAARLSAQHITSIDPESPEALTLLGAIASASGEHEEALDLFYQAIDVDPGYFDAFVYAAEIAIHPLGEIHAALDLCEEAAAIAQEPDEIQEIETLRAEALVASGEQELARTVARGLDQPPPREAAMQLRVGRVLLEVDEPERALSLFESCREEAALQADAHYFSGVALEMLAQPQAALERFLTASELDRAAPPAPWSTTPQELQMLAESVLKSLPGEQAEKVHSLPVRVFSCPPMELIAEGFDPRALVFVSAALPPMTEGGQAAAELLSKGARGGRREGGVEASCLFVYQRNLERYARSTEEIQSELASAIDRELSLMLPAPPPAHEEPDRTEDEEAK